MLTAVQSALQGRTGMYEGNYVSVLSGKNTPSRALYSPILTPEGQILGGVGIFEDITARKQAEDALRDSEQHYRSLFENMLNGFAYCQMHFEQNRPADFTYLNVNHAFEALTGLKDVIGKRVSEVIPGIREADPELLERYGRVASTGNPEQFETYVASLGMWFAISVYSPHPEYFVAVFDVITERKQTEDALRTSLAEKVALLKEVHHRVKNNLQIVASLLRLQASRSQDQNVVDVLQETRNRVHSMALLHEVLYRSGNLASVNFAAYVEDLTKHLWRSFGAAAGRITLENHVAPIGLPLDKSLPCGLIINELISNALKHAFPGNRSGSIIVTMEPAAGERLVLSVQDNGVGLSMETTKNTSTLGLRLVSNLVGQLGGIMTVEQPDGEGVVFRVVFHIPKDTSFEGKA